LFQYGLIHVSEAHMSKTLKVTHRSTNTCDSFAIKSLVETVKYLEFLAKVYSTITGNVAGRCL